MTYLYTEASGTPLLKFDFDTHKEYEEFMESQGFTKRCDRSGLLEFPESLVLILTENPLKDYVQSNPGISLSDRTEPTGTKENTLGSIY